MHSQVNNITTRLMKLVRLLYFFGPCTSSTLRVSTNQYFIFTFSQHSGLQPLPVLRFDYLPPSAFLCALKHAPEVTPLSLEDWELFKCQWRQCRRLIIIILPLSDSDNITVISQLNDAWCIKWRKLSSGTVSSEKKWAKSGIRIEFDQVGTQIRFPDRNWPKPSG